MVLIKKYAVTYELSNCRVSQRGQGAGLPIARHSLGARHIRRDHWSLARYRVLSFDDELKVALRLLSPKKISSVPSYSASHAPGIAQFAPPRSGARVPAYSCCWR